MLQTEWECLLRQPKSGDYHPPNLTFSSSLILFPISISPPPATNETKKRKKCISKSRKYSFAHLINIIRYQKPHMGLRKREEKKKRPIWKKWKKKEIRKTTFRPDDFNNFLCLALIRWLFFFSPYRVRFISHSTRCLTIGESSFVLIRTVHKIYQGNIGKTCVVDSKRQFIGDVETVIHCCPQLRNCFLCFKDWGLVSKINLRSWRLIQYQIYLKNLESKNIQM